MQDLEDLFLQRDQINGEILRKLSDMRADSKVKEVVKKLFDAFPDCGAIVLMSAWKGEKGERRVYGFDEIEESQEEGFNDLVTINYWICNHRPAKWEPEIDDLFEELAEVFPYPIEEEFDWDGMELGEKREVIIWKEDV